MFRLDRTAFRIATFTEADSNVRYWLTRPVEERLRAANFLTRQAYNLLEGAELRMDRRLFRIRTHSMEARFLSKDFRQLIAAFQQEQVEYILVGGYAVILHGYNRSTGDLDLWVNATPENYDRIRKAFELFGMPVFDMSEQKFLATDRYGVFRFGAPPVAINLLTKLSGLAFGSAFADSVVYEFGDVQLRVLRYEDLIVAKRAAARNRDLNDIEQLEKRNG